MTDETVAQLEEEFLTLSAALGRRLADITADGGASDLKEIFKEADEDVYDATNTLKKLSQEVRQLSYHAKSKAQQRLDGMEADFNKQVARLRALKASGGSDDGTTDKKAGSESRADRQADKETRRKLLAGKAVSDDTSISLERTAAVLAATEEGGMQTTRALIEQRETLIRSRETIRETDDFLVKSSKTLRRMRRRIVTNKLITGFIILIEMAGIGLIIWLKWYR